MENPGQNRSPASLREHEPGCEVRNQCVQFDALYSLVASSLPVGRFAVQVCVGSKHTPLFLIPVHVPSVPRAASRLRFLAVCSARITVHVTGSGRSWNIGLPREHPQAAVGRVSQHCSRSGRPCAASGEPNDPGCSLNPAGPRGRRGAERREGQSVWLGRSSLCAR